MERARKVREDGARARSRERNEGQFAVREAELGDILSPHPLTFVAEEMWFHHLLDPASPAYNEWNAFHIRGPLDVAALQRALDAFAARHPAHRMAVHADGNGGYYVAYDGVGGLSLRVCDLPGAKFDDERACRLIADAVAERYDLTGGPLSRALLVRFGLDEHVLVIMAHHILWDGATRWLFRREVAELYTAAREGRSPRLDPAPMPAGKYARQQRRRFAEGAFDDQIRYWVKELDGVEPLDLRGDHPRPPVLDPAGATCEQHVDLGMLQRLRAFARSCDASLFQFLSASWALALARFGAIDDIPIGFAIDARNPELDGSVGCFINTLVFRARIDEDETFRAYLSRTSQTLRRAYEARDVPFQTIVQRLAPQRRSDQTPIFSTMIALEPARGTKLELAGTDVEQLRPPRESVKFDLTFDVREQADGARCRIEYRRSLYEPSTIAELLRSLLHLIDAVVAEPDRPLREIETCDDAQRRRLAAWECGSPREHAGSSVLERIDEWISHAPDAPAVRDAATSLTYRALDERASRITAALAQNRDAEIVALDLERGIDAIAAAIGALRGGKTILPIDRDYPAPRRDAMLADSCARVVIDDAFLATALASAAGESSARTARRRGVPAYLLYTSGSTGTPNGVLIEDPALLNAIAAFVDATGIGPGDVLLALASPSFDLSLEEMFGALCSGALLAVAPPAARRAIPLLLDAAGQAGATILDLPTALVHELAAALRAGRTLPESVRLIVAGGEALSRDAAADILSASNGRVRVLNTYGPTETTIAVTTHEVTAEDVHANRPVPIGRPIPNVTVYVLDERKRRVPPGAVGMLYVGGIALARGYLHREELTAGRFIEHPEFGRLYRTGDLARRRDDGELEFCGRRDGQFKVRGFRIEPGEIEAALRSHPEIDEAAVAIDGSVLVAAVTGRRERLSERAIRQFLSERVPSFAIPGRLAIVDALPRTPNGKIDRRAVAALQHDGGGEPPATEKAVTLETQLTMIWEELLGRTGIGRDDDFFEIGGHSLLAARMFSLVEAQTGVHLPLQVLLEHSTIATLAQAMIDREMREGALATMLEPQRSGPPFFFLHADVGGGGFYTRTLARKLTVDRPVVALAPHGSHGEELLQTVAAMAEHYVREMRSLQPRGPYTVGGHCLGGIIAIEIARQLRAAGEDVDPVIAINPSVVYALGTLTYGALRPLERAGVPKVCIHGVVRRESEVVAALLRLLDPRRRSKQLRSLCAHLLPSLRVEEREQTLRERLSDELYAVVRRHEVARNDLAITILEAEEVVRFPGHRAPWRVLFPRARFVSIPGDHLGCVTRHADATAQILSGLLDY